MSKDLDSFPGRYKEPVVRETHPSTTRDPLALDGRGLRRTVMRIQD